MSQYIASKKGLKTLLKRYRKAGATDEDIKTVEGCIREGLAMDDTDYENAPKAIRKLWAGLK